MEATNKTKSKLLYVILGICLLNLLGIVFLILGLPYTEYVQSSPEKAPLPAGLDSQEERRALFEKFKPLYNAKDCDNLYAFFDEAVQVQVSKEELKEMLENLYSFTGEIKNGAYMSYEAQARQSGMCNYILHYLIDTEKGKADLNINVFQQGREPYRITGFRINKD